MYKIGEFKGHPVISLMNDENDERPFTFGLVKAKLILSNIKSIEEFVEQHEEK